MKQNRRNIFQTINKAIIFKAGIPALCLLFSFKPTDKGITPDVPTVRKEIKSNGDFQKIRLDGNVSVILTNDPPGTVIVEGREKDVNRVWHSLKQNTLVINANRTWLVSSKLTIYLSALTVLELQVNGDTDISSAGIIKANDLHISMNGNIDVKVKTNGKISVDAPEGYELQWKTPVLTK